MKTTTSLLCACILLAGCEQATTPPEKTGETITRPNFTLAADEAYDFDRIPVYIETHQDVYDYIDANIDDHLGAIQRWLRSNIAYLPGSSTVPVSAETVNERGYGVCRDLAHLGIALCRSLSIPARMVVGCLKGLEPMDLHAWFEAFVGGRWYTFDATQATLCSGYVAYAYGRDAADVAIYTQFGPPVLPYFQQVTVTNPDESHQS